MKFFIPIMCRASLIVTLQDCISICFFFQNDDNNFFFTSNIFELTRPLFHTSGSLSGLNHNGAEISDISSD